MISIGILLLNYTIYSLQNIVAVIVQEKFSVKPEEVRFVKQFIIVLHIK